MNVRTAFDRAASTTSGHRGFAASIRGLRASLTPFVPAIGSLDFDAGDGASHLGLPSDVFTISLDVDQIWLKNVDAADLSVVIAPVRTHLRRLEPVGRARLIIATLTPLGMFSAFRSDLSGLTDRPLPLASLSGRSRTQQLVDSLRTCMSLDECSAQFGRWLEERIGDHCHLEMHDLRVSRAAMMIFASREPSIDFDDIARAESVTRRQLERDFRRCLGMTPGFYGRLVRFQRAAGAVAAGESLSQAAFDHGFSDQSHMTRTFRELAGVTPGELAREGARPGRDVLRSGLGGRVFLFDVPTALASDAGVFALREGHRGSDKDAQAANDVVSA